MKTEPTPENVGEMRKFFLEYVLASLPPEEVLSRYTPEQRLKGLAPEEIQGCLHKIIETAGNKEGSGGLKVDAPLPRRYVESGILSSKPEYE